MSFRYKGGIISATPPTISTSSATGIWTMQQQMQAQAAGDWPTSGVFNTDSYAANLYLALSFTTYQSATTGGGYVDLSPQIRTAQGLSPGTAKVATQTGTSTINSGVASPLPNYTDTLVFPTQQTSNSHLFYYSYQLGVNQALTVEFWAYMPSGWPGSTWLATNNFGGGYYPAWNLYRDQATTYAKFFTNTGGSQYIGNGPVSLGAWHHIAYVFDGTGASYQQYVDGVRGYSGTYGTNTGQSIFTIGATNWDGINNITGLRFQDFRIYTGIQKYSGASFPLSTTNPNYGGAILK